MINYVKRTTTNYFQVTSEQALRNLVSRIDCTNKIELLSCTNNNKTFYKLYTYGSFDGVDGDYNDEELYEEFQKVLPDNEILIIFSICYEDNSHDLSSGTVVITNKIYKEVSIKNMAISIAKDITDNSDVNLNL